jgi:hypothetical protein
MDTSNGNTMCDICTGEDKEKSRNKCITRYKEDYSVEWNLCRKHYNEHKENTCTKCGRTLLHKEQDGTITTVIGVSFIIESIDTEPQLRELIDRYNLNTVDNRLHINFCFTCWIESILK